MASCNLVTSALRLSSVSCCSSSSDGVSGADSAALRVGGSLAVAAPGAAVASAIVTASVAASAALLTVEGPSCRSCSSSRTSPSRRVVSAAC